MTANHGYRVAVCMNDFGDTTDIESTAMSFNSPSDPSSASSTSPSLPAEPATKFLSLPNGCLCCSIKEPGIAAIEDMVTNIDPGSRPIDWVVVELTGLADPAEIARSFWTNEEQGGKLRLDGVIGVVDSKNLAKQLETSEDPSLRNQAQRQIAASDVILLNKADIVSAEESANMENLVRSINSSAVLKKTTRSVVPDLGELFPLGVYSGGTGKALEWATTSASASQHPTCNGDDRCSHTHTHAAALSDVHTISLDVPILSAGQRAKVEDFLQVMHWEGRLPGTPSTSNDETSRAEDDGFTILRSKGLFIVTATQAKTNTASHGRVEILQGVRDIFELKSLDLSSGTASEQDQLRNLTQGKLVIIGKGLGDKEQWQKSLDDALES